ncbi:MAG: PhoX family protein, partial [Planctomycetes bacterium]|nr:PhoX family protein [Planctomycetota bacterium]
YCFEVDAYSSGPEKPVALSAMGRFVHEAVAVDPATGTVYLTEDQLSAGFYRYLSFVPGRLAEGGRLEMLAVDGKPGFDTRTGQKRGAPIPCHWVPIDDPDPRDAHARAGAVFEDGLDKGGAIFGRLEGCWYGDGSIYMNATNGGDEELGQVWRYFPRGPDAGDLHLVFESPSIEVLESPDNLCVSPRGGLVLCEDFAGPRQHVSGLSPEGEIFDLARNEWNDSEFAGATFSPDGQTLFVNIQVPGVTLAIWGDWERPRALL